MPSIYLKKASMPSSYQVVMPFGTFNIGLNQREGENEVGADDDVEFVYGGQRITRAQYRLVLAERDRLADIDAARVTAANAARDKVIEERLARSTQAQLERPLMVRRKLEDKIAWADAEIARVNIIRSRAQRDLEELQS